MAAIERKSVAVSVIIAALVLFAAVLAPLYITFFWPASFQTSLHRKTLTFLDNINLPVPKAATMAPSIKLYYAPNSCSMASQLLLEDSGLPFEATVANIRDPAARAEYVKNVNPKGQVPALVIDGEVVTEAPAIITAISQAIPEKHYTGNGPKETVRFYEWMNYLSGTVHTKSFTGLFRPSAFHADPSAAEGVTAQSRVNIETAFKNIEERLADQGSPSHALGNRLTGVDAYLLVFWTWAQKFNFDLAPYPSYAKVVDELKKSEAFTKMWAKQG